MKKTRLKPQTLADEAAFQRTIDNVVALQLQANKLAAQRDAEIVAIQQRYAKTIEPLEEQIEAKVALAADYAERHRSELQPKDRKSVETACAIFGWRLGNRTVKAINKQWTEEKIIKALEDECLFEYVREVKAIAKDMILADCEDNTTLVTFEVVEEATGEVAIPADVVPLARVGLKITQKETFFIEPKAESAETLKAQEASAR